ncbi:MULTISPECIES: sigma-E factor regulatory protein RseB domain-containing protein [Streptosporangium]|uniref:Sigma-E factor negative regulatory protein RseB n=1 Tax=Streptosporangium brasiliense TaxID=47480 RepID=A0ABT9R9T2_9ACTN|nr:sigma-E factor regulatory protein RseB domain-containing protein [Streptosporangium brasiliense]MDP9865175.1 sigma-E factor negative regulatory protein RseB [Streptosporangium brasiliense]
MIRLPVTVVLAAVMLLGLVMGGPAHAVQPDESDSDDTGLHLLREAAVAGRARGYSGTQYVTAWGRSAAVSSVLEVRNVPGEGLTVHAQPSGLLQRVDPGTPAGGMSTPSETMLEVLARNYRVVAVGEGRVCGRPARLVHAVRADGTVAARYWLDEAGGPVLRRELLDGRGRVVHAGAFVDLTLDPARQVATPALAAGGFDLGRTPALRARGWRFPDLLPGRLELFAAHDASPGYLYLGYSDGLSVVSVFIQPGVLDEERLRGWHARQRNGHTIWIRDSAEQETIWASGGHVYTVFADAPADMVDAAVAALPHEPLPSLWTRLGRGADRLLSWVNPFG